MQTDSHLQSSFLRIAMHIIEKAEALLKLPVGDKMDILTDHITLFGQRFAFTFSLTKE